MELQSPLSIAGVILVIALVLFGLNTLIGSPSSNPSISQEVSGALDDDSSPYPLAPELVGIAGYINADEGLTLGSLKGKVVIVDFWTYSCINCIRTQPYLNAWYEKYRSQGLEIVGVHTPEFDFEKKYENVLGAIEKEKIQYPVVLDNDYHTWRAYQNRYWPRKYLIDAQGRIRYDHIGEGSYEETEKEIQLLLEERDQTMSLTETISNDVKEKINATEFQKIGTPELYLGYEFARAPLANSEGFQPGQTVSYSLPSTFTNNLIALEGEWINHAESMELNGETGKVVLPFTAKQVNIVASGPAQLHIALDGGIETILSIEGETLYTVVDGTTYDFHTLTLNVKGKGFKLYTFTFG